MRRIIRFACAAWIAAPCSGADAQPAATPPLLAPVTPACISSPFGPRILPGLPKAGTFHPGIDLPAPAGAPVRAVADGQVIAVRRRGAGVHIQPRGN